MIRFTTFVFQMETLTCPADKNRLRPSVDDLGNIFSHSAPPNCDSQDDSCQHPASKGTTDHKLEKLHGGKKPLFLSDLETKKTCTDVLTPWLHAKVTVEITRVKNMLPYLQETLSIQFNSTPQTLS